MLIGLLFFNLLAVLLLAHQHIKKSANYYNV